MNAIRVVLSILTLAISTGAWADQLCGKVTKTMNSHGHSGFVADYSYWNGGKNVVPLNSQVQDFLEATVVANREVQICFEGSGIENGAQTTLETWFVYSAKLRE